MEWIGTLRYVDLGAGQWVLEQEEGGEMPLVGAVPAHLRDHEVVVQGRRVDALGFGRSMQRSIEVRDIRPA
ncbi:MAG: hypothetical protein H6732_00505 [Alphaproteobacteria bacterium]|nr:hypothetical protein [Alphaproteobacteria bacterium]